MDANLHPRPQGPGADDRDALWDLLGRAPLPEPDGWFAARTLARCRNASLTPEAAPVPSWRMRWRWILGAGLACALAAGGLEKVHRHEVRQQRHDVQEAFEIVASLDSDSSSSWLDSSL